MSPLELRVRNASQASDNLTVAIEGHKMIATFKRTMAMAKGSWAVLRQDKELMALPVIGAVVMVLVAVALFIPVTTVLSAMETTNELTGRTELSNGGAATFIALLLLGYFLLVLINQVFAGGVVHGAYTRMTGGDPTITSSVAAAGSRILQLAPWALATGTVGLILDFIRDKGFIGRIIAGLISFAWKTATFLVLPVLVIEGLGPKAAYNRSKQLMSNHWGESANATFGFLIIGFVVAIPGIALIALAQPSESFVLMGLGVAWFVATSVVITTLNGVMRAALYLYTVHGRVPADFENAGLQMAFSR